MTTLPNDNYPNEDLDCLSTTSYLHYAPPNHRLYQGWVAALVKALVDDPPVLLYIDVSVEVAHLAGQLGIPYVYVIQHGNRRDLPHQLVYQNAVGLIGAFPEDLVPKDNLRGLYPVGAIAPKSQTIHRPSKIPRHCFTGFFSSYPKKSEDQLAVTAKIDTTDISLLNNAVVDRKRPYVLVVIGGGGTQANIAAIQSIRAGLDSNLQLVVAGRISETSEVIAAELEKIFTFLASLITSKIG